MPESDLPESELEDYKFPDYIWIVNRLYQNEEGDSWASEAIAAFPDNAEAKKWANLAEAAAKEKFEEVIKNNDNSIHIGHIRDWLIPEISRAIPTAYDSEARVKFTDESGPCIYYTVECVPFFKDRVHERLSR